MVAAGLATPATAATETITIAASAPIIVVGDQVQLSGVASGDAGCSASRSVQLEWQAADSSAWAVVATGTTAADGTYSFANGQQYSGSFRATLPLDGACTAVASDAVTVRVRASVESMLVASSLTAGSCLDLSATVSPDKSGQNVELQRRSSSGWTTVDTLTLDATSSVSARPCFGWADIGIVRLRVRWPSQDALNATGTGITLAFQITKAPWMERIDNLLAGRAVSVSVGENGSFLYERADTAPRTPASSEKLFLSMALLDALGPDFRIPTYAASGGVHGGVVKGNLWILGRGDPSVTPARMAALARRIEEAGITEVHGRVMGATTYFLRDWWATGWPSAAHDYVALPTALTFDGNVLNGRNVTDPERLAARSLTRRLEARGIAVGGKPGAGTPPSGLSDLASIRSRDLGSLLTSMNRFSNNFAAEVLGKLLAARLAGPPGTIAEGASQARAWVAAHGLDFTLYDGSGLSYANRVTAQGIVRLLWTADGSPWGAVFRQTLPAGGQGTLEDRLTDVELRAKTGTLDSISALSGWVWLEKENAWGEFSILSNGMDKTRAIRIEDKIVRILTASAH